MKRSATQDADGNWDIDPVLEAQMEELAELEAELSD